MWRDYVLLPLDEAMVMLATTVPYFVAALAVFLLGWLAALLLRATAARVLRAFRFDRLAERIGLRALLDALRVTTPAHLVVSRLLYAFALLFALTLAVSMVDVPGLNQFSAELGAEAPLLVVALAVFIAGLYVAMRARKVIDERLTQRAPKHGPLVAETCYWALIAVVASASLDLVGIDTTLLQVFLGAGAIALAGAFAISFGLGGRAIAQQYLEEWLSAPKESKSPGQEDADV